jgi:DNA-binding XRE family transcriptional regulator
VSVPTTQPASPIDAIAPEELARLRAAARLARAEYAHKPTWEEVVGPEGVKNAAPFYFELLAGVAQLKTARQALGLSLADVAAKGDVSADELERLEAGRLVNPSWQLLGRYAVAVGRTLRLAAEPDQS